MLCTCLVSFNQIITGASFVFSSLLLAKLKEPTSQIKIDNDDASWIASVLVLVCPTGLLIIGLLTGKLGRRTALQISYIPLIISWIVLAYANSLKTIIIGRIIMATTFGSGTCTYVYLSEVCPIDYRPLCFSVVAIFVGLGMMSECILAMFFHWQTMSAIMFAASTAACVSLFVMPETPLWLRNNGRVPEAEMAEKWFGVDETAVDGHLERVHNDIAGRSSYWNQFTRPTVWKPMLITLAFFVCQQCSGFYVLLYYSVDVLRDCRVQWDGVMVTTYLSVAHVLGSLAYSALHHIRRKTITVVSGGGMAMSLIAAIAYVRTYRETVDPPYAVFPVVAFVAYMFFAMLAMLPLPWAICSELFPIAVKGTLVI